MISVGIIGGSGYTGKLLVKFCAAHKYIDSFTVFGKTTAGEPLWNVFPELHSVVENSVVKSIDELDSGCDVYFIALPHGEALKYVPSLIEKGKKVIDLGGDYRLDDPAEYEKWYGGVHTSAELLCEKSYGLADTMKEAYSTNLIANPGCYPTATLLSLLPAVSSFGEDILSISTAAYSGTSGAGKSAKTEMLLSEMYGNVRAYNVNKHRHQPEIKQQLNKSGLSSPFSFTTHLLPAAVGIYATSAVHLKKAVPAGEVMQAYRQAYDDSAFVRLRNTPPDLTWVTGSNYCDINVSVEGTSLIVTSAIDNLVKGASGQAMQNLNKIYGWEEHTGIQNFSTGVK